MHAWVIRTSSTTLLGLLLLTTHIGVASEGLLGAGHEIPRSGDAEEALWQDLRDGVLDDYSLLQAAMIAGGCGAESVRDSVEAACLDFCHSQIDSLAACTTEQQRAGLLLRGMRATLLTGSFEPSCYRLDRSLTGGCYNCLTATILYVSLCRKCGVSVVAEATETHLFCRLAGEESVIIQTTGDEPWWPTSPGAGAAPPPLRPTGARELNDAQVIAQVYYNRGTMLLRQHEFGRSVRYLSLSGKLDPANAAARHNLVAAYNGWALQLCDKQHYGQAANVLAHCGESALSEGVTRQNDLYIHHRWVIALCRQHRFGEALELLEAGHDRQPQAELYDAGRWTVVREWAACAWTKRGLKLPGRCSPGCDDAIRSPAH